MADKLIVDCQTGERTTEPLTQAEKDDRAAMAQAEADRQAAREAADTAWQDAIRNAADLAELKAVLAGDTDVGQADRRPS